MELQNPGVTFINSNFFVIFTINITSLKRNARENPHLHVSLRRRNLRVCRPSSHTALLSLGWRRSSERPSRMYRNGIPWPILVISRHQPHPLYYAHAAIYPSKDGMLPIQKWGRFQRNEELTPVRVWACIGHANDSGASVLQVARDFVGKLASVDALSAPAGAGRIASLDHEVANYPVEDCAVVVARFGQCCHVVASSGCVAVVELNNEGADTCIELNVGVGLVAGGRG